MKKTDTSSYSFQLSDSLWQMLFGFIFIFIGASIAWRQFNEVNDLLLYKQWPSTQGRVETSDLFWTESVADYDLPEKLARISYAYSVGSQIYKGTASTEAIIFTSSVNRFSAKYPEGSQITVYFHPDSPNQSIVEPGLNLNFLEMLVSLIVIIMGLLIFGDLVRKRAVVFNT